MGGVVEEIVEQWDCAEQLAMDLGGIHKGPFKTRDWMRSTFHGDFEVQPLTSIQCRFEDATGREVQFPLTLVAEAVFHPRDELEGKGLVVVEYGTEPPWWVSESGDGSEPQE